MLGAYTVGNHPIDIAFDGTYIWVTTAFDGSLTKLRASDGAPQGTFKVGTLPSGIIFDGTNIWVADSTEAAVKKVRTTDGVVIGMRAVGQFPFELEFDGTDIWVGNQEDDTVMRLSGGRGAVQHTYAVGRSPHGIVSMERPCGSLIPTAGRSPESAAIGVTHVAENVSLRLSQNRAGFSARFL